MSRIAVPGPARRHGGECRAASRPRDAARGGADLIAALFLLGVFWSLLLAVAPIEPWLGQGPALVLAFLIATALAVTTRPRTAAGSRAPGRSLGMLTAGLVVGYVSYSGWIAIIVSGGLAIGLSSVPAVSEVSGDALTWTVALLLAPLVEETVYRARLLPALSRLVGSGPAIVFTAILFAVPHVQPWSVLGTLLVGLMLGAVMHLGRSLALCVGIHMGLNGAVFLCGLPATRLALDPSAGRATGAAVLVLTLLILRARRRRRADSRAPASWRA